MRSIRKLSGSWISFWVSSTVGVKRNNLLLFFFIYTPTAKKTTEPSKGKKPSSAKKSIQNLNTAILCCLMSASFLTSIAPPIQKGQVTVSIQSSIYEEKKRVQVQQVVSMPPYLLFQQRTSWSSQSSRFGLHLLALFSDGLEQHRRQVPLAEAREDNLQWRPHKTAASLDIVILARKLRNEDIRLITTMSFPAFSGLLATFMAAAAAAPDEIPTCTASIHA